MKNIVSILLVLVGFAANAQIQDYVIEASDSLITRGVLQIDTDKFKATTQVSSDDTTLVSLDYLTNLLDAAEYADSLAFHSGTGYLVYYRSGVALDSTSLDGRYLTAEVDGSVSNELQNLSLGTTTTTTQPINISGGSGITLPSATTSLAGLMSAADKSVVNGITTNYVPYTGATQSVNLGAYNLTGNQLVSTVATGTAPLSVASQTVVPNLNAEFLNGLQKPNVVYGNTSNGYQYNIGNDANQYSRASFNTIYNVTNAPFSTDGGLLNIPAWNGQTSTNRYNLQIAGALNSPSNLWYRATDINGAGTWYKILNEANFVVGTHYSPAHNIAGNYLIKSDGLKGFSQSLIYDNGTNVGIGTTSPVSKLTIGQHIYSFNSEGSSISFMNNYPESFHLAKITSGTEDQYYKGYLSFSTPTYGYANVLSERMRIVSDGNVGIGTTEPTQKLDVNGNARFRSVGTTATTTVLGVTSDGTLSTNVSITGGATWKGGWNASTNTPTLSDATGTNGWWYKVTVAGTQNLGSGSITFAVGDDVIHNGTVWQKFSAMISEADPVFVASDVYDWTTTDSTYWRTAYNWGDHSVEGYLTAEVDGSTTNELQDLSLGTTTTTTQPINISSGTGVTLPAATTSLAGLMTSTDKTNLNTAYGWGNHSGLYLLLTGGTMANTNLVTNMNADLLDGYSGQYWADNRFMSNQITDFSTNYRAGVGYWVPGATNAPYPLNGNYGSSFSFVGMGTPDHNNLANWLTTLYVPTEGNDIYFRKKINASDWTGLIKLYNDANFLAGTHYQAPLTNPVTGTGTTNYLPKWTGMGTLGNSLIYDNGTNVGIGTTSPSELLSVVKTDINYGSAYISLEGNITTTSGDASGIKFYNNYPSKNSLATISTTLSGQTYYADLTFSTVRTGYANVLDERMRITQGGSLLFGDSVKPTEGTWLGTGVFGKSGYNKVILGTLNSNSTGATIGGHNSTLNDWADLNINGKNIIFRNNETEIARFNDVTGNLAIGHTTPSQKLDVNGNIRVRGVGTGTGISLLGVTSDGTLTTSVSGLTGNWTTAYNDRIASAAFTGTTTKTMTLTQQDGGTVTANFTDNNTTYTGSAGVQLVGDDFRMNIGSLNAGAISASTHYIPWYQTTGAHWRTTLAELQAVAGYNAGKLQNVAIASTAPTTNYVMKYNGSSWAPAPDATGAGALTSGDAIVVTGDSINYKPTRITATMTDLNMLNNAASIYTNFEYGGAIYRTTLGQLSDLGLYNARELRGYTIASATPNTGEVLKWTGSQWEPEPDNTGGMTDPMTSRGDIIYRNSSNVTARLGRGTAGQLLYSNGTDLSWRTPVKADIGLGNVENTALSTWTGSTNIGTVGSITTGTWSATPISAVKGGTGKTSYTPYALLAGGTTSSGTLQQVSNTGDVGDVLTYNGAGALPTWQTAPSGGGMTDPMTTAGDMIYRNLSNVTARLPRGTNGEILTLVSGVPSWEPKQIPTLQAFQVGYGDLGSELTGSDYFVFYEDASYSRLNIGGGTGTVTLKTVDMAINTSTPATPVSNRASIYLDYKGNLTKWEAGGLPKPIESQQDSAFVASAIGGYGGSLNLTGSLGDGMYTYEITASAINLTGTIVNTYKYNLSFRFVSGAIVWQRFTEVYKNETNTNIGLDDTTPVEVEDIGLNCRVIVNLFSSVTVTNTHFSADAKRIAYKPE
jgi:hypothetical protein